MADEMDQQQLISERIQLSDSGPLAVRCAVGRQKYDSNVGQDYDPKSTQMYHRQV
jgi:hypothetical protein